MILSVTIHVKIIQNSWGCMRAIPSTKSLMASLYVPQLTPMAAFKLVYKGSRSMRGAVFTVLMAFCGGSAGTPLTLDRDREAGWAVVTEFERLKAAGSMSGIA